MAWSTKTAVEMEVDRFGHKIYFGGRINSMWVRFLQGEANGKNDSYGFELDTWMDGSSLATMGQRREVGDGEAVCLPGFSLTT